MVLVLDDAAMLWRVKGGSLKMLSGGEERACLETVGGGGELRWGAGLKREGGGGERAGLSSEGELRRGISLETLEGGLELRRLGCTELGVKAKSTMQHHTNKQTKFQSLHNILAH